MKYLSYLLASLMLFSTALQANTQQLLQLVDYVGVDYEKSVRNGRIIS